MIKHTAGVLDETELDPLSQSISERLARELKKRAISTRSRSKREVVIGHRAIAAQTSREGREP
jgi:hypothetical protein